VVEIGVWFQLTPAHMSIPVAIATSLETITLVNQDGRDYWMRHVEARSAESAAMLAEAAMRMER